MLSKVRAMSSSSLNPKVLGEYLEGLQLSMMVKKIVSNASSTCVCILALLLMSCVTLVRFRTALCLILPFINGGLSMVSHSKSVGMIQ